MDHQAFIMVHMAPKSFCWALKYVKIFREVNQKIQYNISYYFQLNFAIDILNMIFKILNYKRGMMLNKISTRCAACADSIYPHKISSSEAHQIPPAGPHVLTASIHTKLAVQSHTKSHQLGHMCWQHLSTQH